MAYVVNSFQPVPHSIARAEKCIEDRVGNVNGHQQSHQRESPCSLVPQFQEEIRRKQAQQKDKNYNYVVQEQPGILISPYILFQSENGRVCHTAVVVAEIGSLNQYFNRTPGRKGDGLYSCFSVF